MLDPMELSRAVAAYVDAPDGLARRISPPSSHSWSGLAGNDEVCDDASDAGKAGRETRVRVPGAHAIIGFTVSIVIAAGDMARRALESYRQRRRPREIQDAFDGLDDRTLHDLGFHRSEISSIAAEVTGEADCTRVRVMQTMYGLNH